MQPVRPVHRWLVAAILAAACTGDPPGPTDDTDSTSSTDDVPADGTPEGVVGILVVPEDVRVPLGGELTLQAIGLRDDRSTVDLTNLVDWVIDDEDVVTVSNALDSEGLLTGATEGTTRLRAVAGSLTSPDAKVEVTTATLFGLEVAPAKLELARGQQAQIKAVAAWSDGRTTDATGSVRWIVRDPDVAVVDEGRLEARTVGQTRLVARQGEVWAAPVAVTVVARPAPQLEVERLTATRDGADIDVRVTVHNSGTTGAGPFWVDVYGDPTTTPTPPSDGDDFVLVDWIAAGETEVVTLRLPQASDVTEVVTLLDSLDEVAEADETDNTERVEVPAGPSTVPGDLVVWDVRAIADASYVLYEVEVANLSDGPATASTLGVWVDRSGRPPFGATPPRTAAIPAIAPWDVATVEVFVEQACTPCESWIRADATDVLDEPFEGEDNDAGPIAIGEAPEDTDVVTSTGWDSGW